MRNRRVLFLGLAATLIGCAPDYERRTPAAKEAAEQQSKLATDARQAELWKEAAGRAGGDLREIPVALSPVQARNRVAAESLPAQPKPVALPEGQPTAVRIVASPDLPEGAYSGSARITRVDGEGLELDLGQNRRLSLLVRVRSAALRASAGDQAQVDLRLRPDPHDRSEILALKGPAGDGIVTVLEGSRQPVSVRVPLYRLTASQIGDPAGGTMDVQVTVGDERQVIRQGQVVEFKSAGLTVGVVASLAVTGEDVNREEGNPYAIRLLAWPTR